MYRRLCFLVALSILAAACAADEEVGSLPSTATPTPGPARLLLQITEEGGFVPVEYSLTALPRYALYDDGTMYLPGPQIMLYPGPLLPNIQVVLVGREDLEAVEAIVSQMGLTAITEEHNTEAANQVADASSTTVTYYDEAGTHVFSVYAMDIVAVSGPRVDQLRNLIALLDDLSLHAAGLGQYSGDRVQVIAFEGTVTDELSETRAWPLAAAPESFGLIVEPLRCAVLEGSEAAAALDEFRSANQLTRWRHLGTTYTLIPRPLLPGEAGCRDPFGS